MFYKIVREMKKNNDRLLQSFVMLVMIPATRHIYLNIPILSEALKDSTQIL